MNKNISSLNCTVSKKTILSANKVLKQGNLVDGNEITKFEKNFSKFLNKKNILSVSDLSSAIYLILKNLKLNKNDEVVSLSFNCLSSTAPIIKAGLKPLWCDIGSDYPSIDLDHCQKIISKKTKVLILYYIGGYVQNSELVKKFCKKNNLIFIEDVNCSLGSKFNNKLLGNFGDYSVFSFYPNRILPSINGGAISFPNPTKLKKFRHEINYGIEKKSNNFSNLNKKNTLDEIGFFNKFLNLSASIANENLLKLNSRILKVKNNKKFYDIKIKNTKHVSKINNSTKFDTVPWVYFLKSDISKKLINYLKKNNIESNKLHYINHKYRGFKKYTKENNKLKNTEKFYQEIFTVPCGWWLKESEKKKIVKIINNFSYYE